MCDIHIFKAKRKWEGGEEDDEDEDENDGVIFNFASDESRKTLVKLQWDR